MMHRHGLASAIALALVVAPASAALEVRRRDSNSPASSRPLPIASLLRPSPTMPASLQLTPDNFDNAVSGKSAFVKFLAPW